MKKTIAFLLIALLTLSFSAALADSVPMSKEDQMVGLVKSFLEEEGMDVEGMSPEEIEEAAEIFALPDGRYLIVEG